MKTRNTIQRDLIMEAARRLDHPTAEEVYLAVRAVYPSISRGTVYRNLHILTAQNRLQQVAITGAADRFDKTVEPHYHLVCRVCGAVADANLPYQWDLLSALRDNNGYQIDEHEIILRGYCSDCLLTAAREQAENLGAG